MSRLRTDPALMARMARAVVLSLACTMLLVGCGTVANGVKQDVAVTSDPPGATFVVSPSGVTGVTPATIQLERQFDYTFRFSLAGYQERKAYVRRTMSSGPQWANVASCLVLPFICMAAPAIDEKGGGQFNLIPNPLNVALTVDDGAANVDGDTRAFFFNAQSDVFVTFSVDGGEECKLGPKKFALRLLAPGTHHVEAFHWDVFKMTGTSDVEIDGSEEFIAIYDSVYSTHAAPVNEMPEGFEEDCGSASVPGEVLAPAPNGAGSEL